MEIKDDSNDTSYTVKANNKIKADGWMDGKNVRNQFDLTHPWKKTKKCNSTMK